MTFYRRNLPHWHPEDKPIFLTWRLYNSLPASLIKLACTAKSGCATKTTPGRRFQILDAALDRATTGPLWLKDPLVATHIIQTLRKGESALHQYSLHSFVVMPNHVHILISPKVPLSRITNGIKGVTSRRARSILALQEKHFWQDESFDHWVRSPEQFDTIRAYIENNPVKAGLAANPQDWPWSSVAQPLLAVQPPTPTQPSRELDHRRSNCIPPPRNPLNPQFLIYHLTNTQQRGIL